MAILQAIVAILLITVALVDAGMVHDMHEAYHWKNQLLDVHLYCNYSTL